MKRFSHDQLAKLVKSAQQGEKEAFVVLYAATVESQLYFATTFLRDSWLAEDVIQSVYLSLFQSLPRLQNPQMFVAYLNRTCYHACLKAKRKLSAQAADSYSASHIDALHQEDTCNDPLNRYLALEQSHEIYKALSALPEEQQAAILMRYYHNLKIREIAIAMDCSGSTVKRYIKDGVSQLKALMQK